MKVLKEGTWKNPWSMEKVCPEKQCGAVVMVEESDLAAVDYSAYNDFYVECVVCGTKISFKPVEVPLRIQHMLNKKRKYSSSWD